VDQNQAKLVTDYMTNLWESEFPVTCKILAAVPDGKRDYRPDEKSRTAWELATHLATADIWFLNSIIGAAFVWDEAAAKERGANLKNVADVVAYYKQEFPAKLNEVRSLSSDKLTAPVDFFGMFTRPNATYLGFANNHSIHHRGQLAAYLRAMGSKVPAIYGSSADEAMGKA
jgi:uncharacterized damage-inducible protein DinB